MGLIDAIGKFEFSRTINFWVGRTLVPTERGELNGPFYHQSSMALGHRSINPISAGTSAAGGAGVFGRDNGVVFFGKVHPGGTHLLYVASVFHGAAVRPRPRTKSKRQSEVCRTSHVELAER